MAKSDDVEAVLGLLVTAGLAVAVWIAKHL
jgi:hypothetical protein